jgi:DNA (cytosine-5)-methyltransferase 1
MSKIVHNHNPTIIDLFSGVGGLSLGAARAGFRVVAAVENDPIALNSHKVNFPDSIHLENDVSQLAGKDLLTAALLKSGQLDGLIGGPPCQGFSEIGRKQINDKRNRLFIEFFRLVAETMPKFFIAENVPGILNERYDSIRAAAFEKVRSTYTILPPIKVRANEYGAPTTRTRIFFIGYDTKRFHKGVETSMFFPKKDISFLKVGLALQGLPIEICPSWQSNESSWQKITNPIAGAFRDLFLDRIPPGVGDIEAILRLSEKNEVSGCLGTLHAQYIVERFNLVTPGKSDPISRSPRLASEGYCPTLRAGTDSSKGSFQAVRPIHHLQPRVITPREAARLQGFPDWFMFHPTKWHSFRQIGNSVSPIVAEELLRVVRSRIS